jgi:hypothetical protein
MSSIRAINGLAPVYIKVHDVMGTPARRVQVQAKPPACDETRRRLPGKYDNPDDNERRVRAWAELAPLREEFYKVGDDEERLRALLEKIEPKYFSLNAGAYPDAYLKCLRNEIFWLREQVRNKLRLEEE